MKNGLFISPEGSSEHTRGMNHGEPATDLGKRLRIRAAELTMSDADVARAAKMSTRNYGHYITRGSIPRGTGLERVARALQTNVPWLQFGIGDPCHQQDDLVKAGGDAASEGAALIARMPAEQQRSVLVMLRAIMGVGRPNNRAS
jgi:transcriptional regulator with XRE-family HTH domain